MDLLVDFISHYIFLGLQASSIITLIFELRSMQNKLEGQHESLFARVGDKKSELAFMCVWEKVQNLYFSLGLHFKTTLYCRIHLPGLEREVASERSQNVGMKNEVIESIIHVLGLHAKHLHIWKRLGN